ncbi:cupric reductase [Branchiostoma belcheri]|nr:cupric reductase [Branchiostoma belcheri]
MDTKVEQNGGSIPMEPKRDFKSGQDEGKTSEASKVPVAILGSGDYSRSLAGRLVRSGFAVVVGSRDPDRNRRLFPQGAEVTTRRAALSGARLVFVAVHREIVNIKRWLLVGNAIWHMFPLQGAEVTTRRAGLSRARLVFVAVLREIVNIKRWLLVGNAIWHMFPLQGAEVTTRRAGLSRARLVFVAGAEVTTRRAALSGARLVFVAVHRENYPDLQQDRGALAGKILIDLKKDVESNAEYLARLLPGSTVVKGFNVVSAWSLESGLFGGSKEGESAAVPVRSAGGHLKEVFISSDDAEARRTVMQLAQDMRFAAVDYGSLRAAREIEAMPLRLLPSWHLALKMVLCVLTFYVLWNVYRGVVFYASGDNYAAHIPIHQVNRALGDTAITTLCLVYTPGVLASFAQLYNGTKYKRFPNWLDKWMRARKQLGLLCLFIASIHACLSVLEWSPAYGYDRLFEKTTVNANGEVVFGMMRWSGETFLLFGTLALFLMAVLGVASIPSVGSSMNWREFNFVQSKLGWTVFLFAVTHCSVYVAEMFIESYLFTSYTPPAFYIDLTLCAVLLLLKIVTLLPCVSSRVDRIRRGWERNAPKAGKSNSAYKEDPEMTSYL